MLLQAGIVRPSLSPWTSPVLPVKKDGTIRLCVDFRKLNTVTVPDPYKMSRIGDIIDRLGKAKFLSKLDLAKGFFQVPVKPKDTVKTSFFDTHPAKEVRFFLVIIYYFSGYVRRLSTSCHVVTDINQYQPLVQTLKHS